jgi:hypothetical protein
MDRTILMHMKLKLVASAILLGLAGSASAAVLNPGNVLGVPGDVVVVAVDNTAGANFEKTFVADLEVTYADLVNGAVTSKTWNLLTDPKYSAAFTGYQGHNLTFYLTGGYTLDNANLTNFDKSGSTPGFPFTDPTGSQWGALVSAKNSTGLTPTFNAVADFSFSGVVQVVQGAVSDNINAAGQNGKSASIDPSPTLGSIFSQNGSFAAPIQLTPDKLLTTAVNGSGSLFWLTTTDPSDTTGTITNLGSVSLNSSTGVLSFGNAAPVPVPAAVWLFGSALAGLLGLGRRAKSV